MRKNYYSTTTLCPHCMKLLPGEVFSRDRSVYLSRTCPSHGEIEVLVCSDVTWFDRLPRFDATPKRPANAQSQKVHGCPLDCGLCPGHRQIAGTAAIEISNRCNANCPVCLGDNRDTFTMPVDEVKSLVDAAIQDQGSLGVLTLSGGEPTIHPQFFDILSVLNRPEIGRINLNTNGLVINSNDAFLERLKLHSKLYVSLHFDGTHSEKIRGISPHLQERALDRLCAANIPVVPLILGVRDVNDQELGTLVPALLQRSEAIKTVIVSLMAHTGANGGRFAFDPLRRLTIPDAVDSIASGSGDVIRKNDFIPVPMPNPICAAVGYFFVDEEGVIPLVGAAGEENTIAAIQNQHFAQADEKMETLFRSIIDNVYANPQQFHDADQMLRRFKRFLSRLFPNRKLSDAQRQAIAEESIKTVFIMQFMDSWTFDTDRLSKCSCQHLLPGKRRIPSCGYYAYHRRLGQRFQNNGTM